MTQEGKHTGRWRVAAYLLLAVLVHGVAIPLAIWWWDVHTPKAPKPFETVSLADYSQAVQDARRQRQAAQRREPLPAAPKKPEEKKEDKLHGQVVDLPPTADNRPPDHADFLSEHNTRTERETRSRHQSPDYNNAMNEPTVTNKEQLATPKTPRQAAALEVGPEKPNKTRPKATDKQQGVMEIPRQTARDRLALQIDPSLGSFKNRGQAEKIEGNSDRLKIAPGTAPEKSADAPGTAPKKGLTMADLVPPVGVLARISGGPAPDALENVEEGEGTFLNSREFKYASFFNRLKRSVSQHWQPMAEYQRRDPTGNIYGYRARITVLTITLNADGALAHAEIKQSSGVDFLDKEALAAFQRAEPFPNPPKGLIDGTGHIIFPFGFHIDFSHGGPFGRPPPMP